MTSRLGSPAEPPAQGSTVHWRNVNACSRSESWALLLPVPVSCPLTWGRGRSKITFPPLGLKCLKSPNILSNGCMIVTSSRA